MSARRAALALWALGLAVALWQLAHTRFVADLSSFLPAVPTAEQRLLVDQLREGALSRVMLAGIGGADAPTRARLSRALADSLRADPRFAAVANGTLQGFERERDFALAHRYALSPRVDAARFGVAGLRSAIAATIDLLASPLGILVKPYVARDPTGETLAVLGALRPAAAPHTVDGVWAAPDGQRALLVARTRAPGSDTDAQAEAVDAVRAAFARAQAAAGPAARAARLALTGPGVFSVASREMIRHDVVRLSLASALVVAALLLAVYRSPRALVLGLVPVASGALAGVAAVSLGFGTVHGITLGFGTALIGEAVDYSIYLFVQAGRGARAGDAAWVEGFWPTIRLGVATSIAGFSALVFSGLPGLAQLGVFSVTGLAVAAAVTRFVLPVLLPAGFRIREIGPAAARLAALARAAPRARALVPLASVAALAVLLAHGGQVWDPRLSSLNPIPAREQALDAALRADLGAADARYLVAVRAPDAETVLRGAERVGARLDPLVAAGALGGYESPARIVPSRTTQRARLAAIPDADVLRARLREALAGLPLRAERLAPFVAEAEAARAAPSVTPADVAGTALGAALDGLLFRDAAGRWTAVLGLRPGAHGIDAPAVGAAVAAAGVPGAAFVDLKAEVDRLYAGYLHRALAMSAVGLAAIVALLFAALRDARRVARVLLPLAAAVLVVAAAHALAGTRLTILHLVGLLLVAAIGSNYALFFDRIAGAGAGREATLASLALANATTVASFGILAASSIPVLHAIGATVAAGAFLALAFSAMLAPCAR